LYYNCVIQCGEWGACCSPPPSKKKKKMERVKNRYPSTDNGRGADSQTTHKPLAHVVKTDMILLSPQYSFGYLARLQLILYIYWEDYWNICHFPKWPLMSGIDCLNQCCQECVANTSHIFWCHRSRIWAIQKSQNSQRQTRQCGQ
jgi:hypothetical protein